MKKRILALALLLLLVGVNAFAADGDLIVNGNVGIGTTNPLAALHVVGDIGNGNVPSVPGVFMGQVSNYSAIQLYGSNGGVIDFNDASGEDADFRMWEHDGRWSVGAGTTGENITILSSGFVGIGTTGPQYTLDVNGTIRGANVSPSDARIKEEVATLENALERVAQLRGVNFRWKDLSKDQGLQMGVIAQEVEGVFPETVSTDSEGYKSVAYTSLVAPLIEAVKELKARNEELQSQVMALQTRVADIEGRR